MVAATSITPVSSSRAPSRFAASALTAGGLLMVLMYACEIAQGILTGESVTPENATGRPLIYLSAVSFGIALIAVAFGLAGIGLALRSRSPKLATIALVLPLLAALFPLFNMLAAVVGLHSFPPVNALSVLANLASATLLGIVALRTR